MDNNKTLGILALAAGTLIVAKSASMLKYWKIMPQRRIVTAVAVKEEIETATTRISSTPAQQLFEVTDKRKSPVVFTTPPQGNKKENIGSGNEILLEFENNGSTDEEVKIFGQQSITNQFRFELPAASSYASGTYRLTVDGVAYADVFASSITPTQFAALLTSFGLGVFRVEQTLTANTYYVSSSNKEFTELELNAVVGNALLITSNNTTTTTASITVTGTIGNTITYNWGDGSSTIWVFTGNPDIITHNYVVPSQYAITITNDVTSISNITIDSPVISVEPIGSSAIVAVDISDQGLQNIDVTSFINVNATQFILSGNDLDTAMIDSILAEIAASALTAGTLDLSGGTNAIPTGGESNANYISLINAGWTVNINNTSSIITLTSNNTVSATTQINIKDSVAGRLISFNWGDATSDVLTTTGGVDNMVHIYSGLGNYTISIGGGNLSTIQEIEVVTDVYSFSNSGNYTALTSLKIINAGLLAIIIKTLLGSTLTTINLSGNALNVSVIDKILLDCDNSGISGGTLNLSGGTNSPPTGGVGNPNLTNLVIRGWAVSTN